MKNTITVVVALVLLMVASSCGRTVYRAKVYKSNKYIKAKQRNHFWHKHGAMPRQHHGGYW